MEEKAKATELVEKGDEIIYDLAARDDQTVNWSQRGFQRKAKYIVLPYHVVDKNARGSIFIQLSKKEEFFTKSNKVDSNNPMDKDSYKILVDEAFQYGQDSGKTKRFLVYHDKGNRAYQHRFAETPSFFDQATHIAQMAGRVPGPWSSIKSATELAKSFIGDYLRDF